VRHAQATTAPPSRRFAHTVDAKEIQLAFAAANGAAPPTIEGEPSQNSDISRYCKRPIG
jgi:hypothetical protein